MLQGAVDTVVATLQSSLPLARLELLDEVQVRACNAYSGLTYPETPHLFLEFHGSEVEVERQIEAVRELANEHGAGEFQFALRQEDRYWHCTLVMDCRVTVGCLARACGRPGTEPTTPTWR